MIQQQPKLDTPAEIAIDAVTAAANTAASSGYTTRVLVERTAGVVDQARAAAQRAGVDTTVQILGTAVRVRFTPRNG